MPATQTKTNPYTSKKITRLKNTPHTSKTTNALSTFPEQACHTNQNKSLHALKITLTHLNLEKSTYSPHPLDTSATYIQTNVVTERLLFDVVTERLLY